MLELESAEGRVNLKMKGPSVNIRLKFRLFKLLKLVYGATFFNIFSWSHLFTIVALDDLGIRNVVIHLGRCHLINANLAYGVSAFERTRLSGLIIIHIIANATLK